MKHYAWDWDFFGNRSFIIHIAPGYDVSWWHRRITTRLIFGSRWYPRPPTTQPVQTSTPQPQPGPLP